MMTIFKSNSFHFYIRNEYIIEEGIRIKRIIKDIFFMSDE